MNKSLFTTAFALGAAAVIWIASIFINSDALAIVITFVIGVAYTMGFIELLNYRQATNTLMTALDELPAQLDVLESWLNKLHPTLQNSVQLRIEGERVALPSPVLTPYLVSLLVMLGLLGTFLGMVDTLKGAAIALEGSTELQAIREGLAAPIDGLALAFGTSVAGVAASAMLGLMSTLSRSERMIQTRRLDTNTKTVFRGFSLYHNRQLTYQALQSQAKALPEVANSLQDMALKLEQMGERLSMSLTRNQQDFHQSVQTVYSDLASSVEQTLRATVADSGRLAGESIKPVLAAAMDAITTQVTTAVERSHQQLTTTAQAQLTAVGDQFSAMANNLQQSLTSNSENLLEKQQSNDKQRLAVWAETFSASQQNASNEWAATSKQLADQLTQLAAKQQQSFTASTDNLQTLSSSLTAQLQQSTEQSLVSQQQIVTHLQQAAEGIDLAGQQTATAMVAKIGELIQAAEHLVQVRTATEQQWLDAHSERMQQLGAVVQAELSGLAVQEQRRGDEAIERLAGLEKTVSEHLLNLGKELEEPMTRLIATASETPKAAAEVISQLRGEISNNIERDNQLLAEREKIMQQLTTLSSSLEQSSAGQREAMESLVNSSATMLKEVGGQFTAHVNSEATKLAETAALFASGTTEMSSLGESFTLAVQLFSDSNQHLMENLNRIESSLTQSSARSDEQLGYYVAQAREIIDHSILSQKQMIEELRQLGKQTELFVENERVVS